MAPIQDTTAEEINEKYNNRQASVPQDVPEKGGYLVKVDEKKED